MVIRTAVRGYDRTQPRRLDEFTLEELPNVTIEQAVEDLREFARIIIAFPADRDIEDSCRQIAHDLLLKFDRLVEAVHNGKVKPNVVAIVALQAGQLAERLERMWVHEEATRKGSQRREQEQRAQRKGVEALKKRRHRNILKVAELVGKKFTPEQQAILRDSDLARCLADSGLGCNRTVRGYIAQARENGLIPIPPEK